MNKYEEALNEIRQLSVSKKQNEIYDLLQELVDKETPMKTVVLKETIDCSKCDTRLGDNNGWTQALVKFCRNCGQKIDWSDND